MSSTLRRKHSQTSGLNQWIQTTAAAAILTRLSHRRICTRSCSRICWAAASSQSNPRGSTMRGRSRPNTTGVANIRLAQTRTVRRSGSSCPARRILSFSGKIRSRRNRIADSR